MAGTKLFTGLVAGALIGGIAGMLMAPKPGNETRVIVVSRATQLKNKAEGYAETLRKKARKSPVHEIEESRNGHNEN